MAYRLNSMLWVHGSALEPGILVLRVPVQVLPYGNSYLSAQASSAAVTGIQRGSLDSVGLSLEDSSLDSLCSQPQDGHSTLDCIYFKVQSQEAPSLCEAPSLSLSLSLFFFHISFFR